MTTNNMVFSSVPNRSDLRDAISRAYRMDEAQCIEQLIEAAHLPAPVLKTIDSTVRELVSTARQLKLGKNSLDNFLHEYALNSEEGTALMCLAEAMLRVPDSETVDRLIRDKISSADWTGRETQQDSFFVNATTWALMLTGRVASWKDVTSNNLGSALKKIANRGGEPVIRAAVSQAMRILGRQFVMGRSMQEALKRATTLEQQGYRYSYDMLGEAARTEEDALRYLQAYKDAITTLGKASKGQGPITGPGISVKLSALHPRYEFAQQARVFPVLQARVLELAQLAKQADIGMTIDAEEADRLDFSLDIIEAVFGDPSLVGWEGFGLAVQSYQKRAWYVIDWLVELSQRHKRRLMVRLIKGAYWDTEVKDSQVKGLEGYPVFTRKNSTDVSFIACARKLLQHPEAFYPQFATHNAYSVAVILALVGKCHDFEFQCLHGMGEALYSQIVGPKQRNIPCRIYAPVGSHKALLAYLVRRLLENGANTSFVNRLIDEKAPLDQLASDPVVRIKHLVYKPHPKIPLPADIYGEARKNSLGLDLTNYLVLEDLAQELSQAASQTWQGGPIVDGKDLDSLTIEVRDPTDRQRVVGMTAQAQEAQIEQALQSASQAAYRWRKTPVQERSACLRRMADLLQENRSALMALAIREAGKTIIDALSEVREAIDFCRYYALRAEQDLALPITLQGPTGELNQLSMHARGPVLCISPWNFPLAIFLGQVSAALVVGNPVLAKPAEQTTLIASAAVRLLHEAGIPRDVLHLLPGQGETVGARLVVDERIKVVMFTGSTTTARSINQSLAQRPGPIIPLIAETGGQNAMIVDSTALPEQLSVDVLASAFGSAGQRCSALRVLFLQSDVADEMIKMLSGAMAQLQVGDPSLLATDIGPVIDEEARTMLNKHIQRMDKEAQLIYRVELPASCQAGTFIAPCAYEIDSLDRLTHEVFGPILHVIRYKAKDLDKVIAAINNTGYGLTLGVHSRIDETIAYVDQRIRAGNVYVNRNIIGAVVGVQPFGGEGLSGTGPKAGGPHYLPRLCNERSISINTTASGGNASLLSLEEDD